MNFYFSAHMMPIVRWKHALLLFFLISTICNVWSDVLDTTSATQIALDDLALTTVGKRWNESTSAAQLNVLKHFESQLRSPESRALWSHDLYKLTQSAKNLDAAAALGILQGTLQQVFALEMLSAYQDNDIPATRGWRAAIKLPRHASAVEGLLALQRINGSSDQHAEVARMLARETIIWQGSRARERADDLLRLAKAGRATPELIALRAAEITTLAKFPPELLTIAKVSSNPSSASIPLSGVSIESIVSWKSAIESQLPDLLSPDDVTRQERLMLKLLRLVPMEYRAGVRDGKVTIPIEYREAVSFTIQAQQILIELRPNWLRTKTEALTKHGKTLDETFATLENTITTKGDNSVVEKTSQELSRLLQDQFGISLRKAGKGFDVVQETALEVRTLLGQSLQAARSGNWRQANAFRLEAYTTFDLEIEARILPRDPTLAIQAERSFLDGSPANPGIKTLLDQRIKDGRLDAAYAQTLKALDESVALLRVGISPTTVALTAFTIVLREGLEAVVILAALLASLRGPENARSRRQVGIGAWGAIIASVVTFILTRTIIQSFSRYGETLEAVISVLAVVILLIVTNWVFHKYYWTGWNARLRELKNKASTQRGQRWEALAMCGVGFLTIYREGFETTLFMQSLILEGGLGASLLGLCTGLTLIGLTGWAIFTWGMKLPYRKLLVWTGVLIVSILVTFLGSTVRLFQTVGWMPIHPIHGLEIPSWMGVWFGIYPSWEGLLIPLLGFAYVGGAWLFVRWQGSRTQRVVTSLLIQPHKNETVPSH